jgi:hypothetical protein
MFIVQTNSQFVNERTLKKLSANLKVAIRPGGPLGPILWESISTGRFPVLIMAPIISNATIACLFSKVSMVLIRHFDRDETMNYILIKASCQTLNMLRVLGEGDNLQLRYHIASVIDAVIDAAESYDINYDVEKAIFYGN